MGHGVWDWGYLCFIFLLMLRIRLGDCPFGILDSGAGLEESGAVHWYLTLYDWHEFTIEDLGDND